MSKSVQELRAMLKGITWGNFADGGYINPDAPTQNHPIDRILINGVEFTGSANIWMGRSAAIVSALGQIVAMTYLRDGDGYPEIFNINVPLNSGYVSKISYLKYLPIITNNNEENTNEESTQTKPTADLAR